MRSRPAAATDTQSCVDVRVAVHVAARDAACIAECVAVCAAKCVAVRVAEYVVAAYLAVCCRNRFSPSLKQTRTLLKKSAFSSTHITK